MSDHERGQVARTAAQTYEDFFVPALFADWPPRLLDAVGAVEGDRVLDVACGTGVLAREATQVVGEKGEVVGIDVNNGMLEVARQLLPDEVTWVQGDAAALPFDDDSFDRVVSQFGLMFFDDQVGALSEMYRTLRPGGRMAVAVWSTLEETPGYAAVAEMLRSLFGSDIAASIEAPYSLGDINRLTSLFHDAGIDEPTHRTLDGVARFSSLNDWIHTDVRGWTLADVIDDEEYALLRREAPDWLSSWVRPDGRVEFAAPAHLVVASKD